MPPSIPQRSSSFPRWPLQLPDRLRPRWKAALWPWPLTFWPWKWCPSRVTWANCVPILVFLGLSDLDLGPMYATDRDRRQTDVRHQKKHRLMPRPLGAGIITATALPNADWVCSVQRREWGKSAASIACPKAKSLPSSGVSPLTPWPGLCPWTPLGSRHRESVPTIPDYHYTTERMPLCRQYYSTKLDRLYD